MVSAVENTVISERVGKLRDSLLCTPVRLSCERIQLLKQVYEEANNEPMVITRAKVLHKVMTEMTIFIDENPIVGTMTRYRLGMQPYPEWDVEWMRTETETFTSLGRAGITEEDKALLRECVDFWEKRNRLTKTQEIWGRRYPGHITFAELRDLGVWSDNLTEPPGRICVDYGKVVDRGLGAVIKEAQEQIARLPLGSLEALRKINFLEAVVISCQAVVAFAERYAALARDMAQVETDPRRKAELEEIAETCLWVPLRPARTFYEAVQAFWFTHLTVQIEHLSQGHSPGRFSQYMYPMYDKDKREGRITDEEVVELLQLLFMRFTEIQQFTKRRDYEELMGNSFQNVSLGGVNLQGEDATNEIDLLLLEAQRRVRMPQPTLSIICHSKMDDRLMLKAAELVRTGIGMPAFFNNDLNIQRLLDHGARLDEARNHCIIGCVEAGFSHACSGMRGGGPNMPKLLELALNNGRDPLTGRQLGPKTGEADTFKSYRELHDAVRSQFQYFLPIFNDYFFTGLSLSAELLPLPFSSALIDDCIATGKDMQEGGSRHNMHSGTPTGMIDMTDSLVAIEKLVFEDKKITMKALLDALEADFVGHEGLQRMLVECPKYGNDDDYPDRVAREWYDIYWEDYSKFKDHLGKNRRPVALSITRHFPFGVVTGALPSGRNRGLPLCDGSVSAEPGKDKNGPTALIRSASKAIDTIKYGCSLLNMKFHPTALASGEGVRKLLALIKSYFDMGGHHLQFNVVSAETLRDAQLHPEDYKDLIVRVAGFSAFFIHLDTSVQNEIIKRTELSL